MDINENPVYVLLNPAINPAQKDLPVTIYESGNFYLSCPLFSNLSCKICVLLSLKSLSLLSLCVISSQDVKYVHIVFLRQCLGD